MCRRKMVKGSLHGTDTKAYLAIQESMTLYSAECEYLHNSMEHGKATRHWFKHYQDNDGKFVTIIGDNGHGMKAEDFRNFVMNYKFHTKPESIISNSCISEFGNGAKDSTIFLSNPMKNEISRVTFESYCSDGTAYRWIWNICASNASLGSYGEDIEEITNDEFGSGFRITIKNSRPLTKTEVNTLRDEISRSFTKEINMPYVTITHNDITTINDKIHWVDPMHFDEFNTGNEKTFRNCEDGIYISPGVVWFKKTINAFSSDGKKNVLIPVITSYFNEDYWKKNLNNSYDRVLTHYCGVYVLKGNTYLNRGGNSIPMVGIVSNGGGAPRIRQCVIVDDSNSYIFEPKSMKMLGVTPFSNNHTMCEKYTTENGDSIYTAIVREYNAVRGNFHKWVRNIKNDYSHKCYFDGFPSLEEFLIDYEEFKNKSSKKSVKVEDYGDITFMPSVKSLNYELNGNSGIISRSIFVDDNGMESSCYSLNKELDENITPQDVLFSVFDILYEMEISSKDFKELNNRLSFKLHHHE